MDYEKFKNWMAEIIHTAPVADIKGYCFNIYEEQNGFSLELVGTDVFDADDDDWATSTIWLGNKRFALDVAITTSSWQTARVHALQLITKYLSMGQHAALLQQAEGIAAGFVDGDLTLLYRQKVSAPKD